MSHGHCQCGQISWKIDVMMSHLVILHISWNSKSPSTYFTFSRNMTCHFMMVHIHKKNIYISNSFHTPYTEPWLQMKHFPSSSLLPQGRRALHHTRLKIKTESVIHLLQMVLGLWGIVHDVQIFQLLSSGARYLVLMVVCHKVGRNQNLHCAPHKVESLLNYSEVRIII